MRVHNVKKAALHVQELETDLRQVQSAYRVVVHQPTDMGNRVVVHQPTDMGTWSAPVDWTFRTPNNID